MSHATQPAVSFLSSAAPILFPRSTPVLLQLVVDRLRSQPMYSRLPSPLLPFPGAPFQKKRDSTLCSLSQERVLRIHEQVPDGQERVDLLVFERLSPLLALRVLPPLATSSMSYDGCSQGEGSSLRELLQERFGAFLHHMLCSVSFLPSSCSHEHPSSDLRILWSTGTCGCWPRSSSVANCRLPRHWHACYKGWNPT